MYRDVLSNNGSSRRNRFTLLLLIAAAILVGVGLWRWRSISRDPIPSRKQSQPRLPTHAAAPSPVPAATAHKTDANPGLSRKDESAREVEIQRRLVWYGGFISDYAKQGKDVNKLTAALTARMNELADFASAARSQGFDERRGNQSLEYARFKGDAYRRFDDQLRAAIGDDDFADLQRYEEKLPERAIVAELHERLAALGVPLDPATEKRVVETLFVTREPDGVRKEDVHPAVRRSDLPGFLERAIPASAFDRLNGILTPQQIPTLHALYDEQQRLGHYADRRG